MHTLYTEKDHSLNNYEKAFLTFISIMALVCLIAIVAALLNNKFLEGQHKGMKETTEKFQRQSLELGLSLYGVSDGIWRFKTTQEIADSAAIGGLLLLQDQDARYHNTMTQGKGIQEQEEEGKAAVGELLPQELLELPQKQEEKPSKKKKK